MADSYGAGASVLRRFLDLRGRKGDKGLDTRGDSMTLCVQDAHESSWSIILEVTMTLYGYLET